MSRSSRGPARQTGVMNSYAHDRHQRPTPHSRAGTGSRARPLRRHGGRTDVEFGASLMRGTTPLPSVPATKLAEGLKWCLNDLYGIIQRVRPDAARAYCPESTDGHAWQVTCSTTTLPMTAQITFRCTACGGSVILDMHITEALSETGERLRTITIQESAKLPGLEQADITNDGRSK